MTAPDGFAVCFSGHRQKKLPSEPLQRVLQSILLDEIQTAIRDGASIFYSGLATGIDLMAAETVLTQRLLHPQIRLIGVKPFAKQNESLSGALAARCQTVETAADQVICISPHYHRGCYRLRNQYMIDHSERLIAVVSDMHSGTGQTIRMAQKRGISLRIIDIKQLESLLLPEAQAQSAFETPTIRKEF
ncbi:MAG: DUF1273 family protein [Oscillospiraceae bacterium]|nr:DUF1273 family protein [Oscillospiraceae bacterium]